MENNDLPVDAVERVREIRRLHHEATKHMTPEERRDYDHQRYLTAKAYMANVKPNPAHFPFLAKK